MTTSKYKGKSTSHVTIHSLTRTFRDTQWPDGTQSTDGMIQMSTTVSILFSSTQY